MRFRLSVGGVGGVLLAIGLAVVLCGDTLLAVPEGDVCCSPGYTIWSDTTESHNDGTNSSATTSYEEPGLLTGLGKSKAYTWSGGGSANAMRTGEAITTLKISLPCAGWSYSWNTEGKIRGLLMADTRAGPAASAQAAFSGGIRLSRDLDASDSGVAASATTSGTSISIGVGAGPEGPSGGGGLNWAASSTPAATGKHTVPLQDSDAKSGPGTECQVKFWGREQIEVGTDRVIPAPGAITKAWAIAAGAPYAIWRQQFNCASAGSLIVIVQFQMYRHDWPWKRTGTATPSGGGDFGPWQPGDGTRLDDPPPPPVR